MGTGALGAALEVGQGDGGAYEQGAWGMQAVEGAEGGSQGVGAAWTEELSETRPSSPQCP